MKVIRRVATALGMAAAILAASAGAANASPSAPLLGPKHTIRGDGVSCVQQAYNYAAGTNLAVDGQYGQQTYEATKNLQRLFKLQVDGVVGKQTGDAIEFIVNQKAGYDEWHAGGCWSVVPSSS
jgi:peptidoglycan hydrolase-like protein with peptidoglycan-binding domain